MILYYKIYILIKQTFDKKMNKSVVLNSYVSKVGDNKNSPTKNKILKQKTVLVNTPNRSSSGNFIMAYNKHFYLFSSHNVEFSF